MYAHLFSVWFKKWRHGGHICRLSSDPTFPTFFYFFGVCPIFPTFSSKFLLFPTFVLFCIVTRIFKMPSIAVKVCISLVFCECQQLWQILSHFTCRRPPDETCYLHFGLFSGMTKN